MVQRADSIRCDSSMADRCSQQQLGTRAERFHRDSDLLFYYAQISKEGSDSGKQIQKNSVQQRLENRLTLDLHGIMGDQCSENSGCGGHVPTI
ncbi:hypothetical protein D3C75_1023980 [compost metagenome]